MKLRITVKVPRCGQHAPDAWHDATYFRSFDVDVPEIIDSLFLLEEYKPLIHSVEVLNESAEPEGPEPRGEPSR